MSSEETGKSETEGLDEVRPDDEDGKGKSGQSLTFKERRFRALTRVLYWGGAFYLALTISIVILKILGEDVDSYSLAITSSFIGGVITTIVGVIAGSSIN